VRKTDAGTEDECQDMIEACEDARVKLMWPIGCN